MAHQVHSAYGDAKATAAVLAACIRNLGGESRLSLGDIGVGGELFPKGAWPTLPVSGKCLRRERAAQTPVTEYAYIARLVAKLPTSSDAAPGIEDYLALLDRVLEDRRVTVDEADALLLLSRGAGLSREQVTAAHRTYMRDLIRVAWEDDVVTEAERGM
jgi:DNA polymerase-3 subunit epsilon